MATVKHAQATVKAGGGVSVSAKNAAAKSAQGTAAKVNKSGVGKTTADWKKVASSKA